VRRRFCIRDIAKHVFGEVHYGKSQRDISRCRSRNSRKLGATAIDLEFAYGVPLFLDQFVEALGQPNTPRSDI